MEVAKNESLERLFETVASLRSAEECRMLFEDMCTVNEIRDMSQRLDAAFLLSKGMPYLDIVKKVGISTATISRVSRSLNYGSGGYKLVISRAEEEKSNDA